MEDSVNLSVAMTEGGADEEQASSLLNHNVSFNSSMEYTTMATTLPANLSFSLSDAERLKLKQCHGNNNNNSTSVNRSALRDLSMNVETNNKNQSCMETSVDMEECSTLEDSERIISLDDSLDEAPCAESKIITEPKESNCEQSSSTETVTPMPTYFEKELVELGRRCWLSTAQTQHYTKGCYWSPDGTCLLVPVHLDGMHVMELPLDLYGASSVTEERVLSKLQSAVHVPEGGTVYDCVWYPLMSSQDPSTCFWLATRQHEPIHMWDAFDGRLRCSYSGYDEVDEVMAAISLAFSQDGQKIYAGYKRCLKIFDVSRPGRICDDYAVKFAISCMTQTSEHPHTVTCGNWKGYIQHFDLRCPPNQGPLFTLGGHSAGITQLRYANDAAGNWQLFSGARKCPKLLQWDMRNYKKPLHEFQRQVNTNQRIQFDLSADQSWLVSGDTDGAFNIWNLKSEDNKEAIKLPVHGDCCNGIGFHPTLPILASTSGQYHFISGDNHENTINTTTPDIPDQEEESEGKRIIDYENAILLLWCGDSNVSI
ncbi:telomerase Cajal body protein 1 homolog [Drosophila innubila]|uniref:telomerase Cajal body protein 1 homolog n=1 Tax=Drosophila innubila TaxID=198719 RepID=UPI00148D5E27|nr:telomerase Cajal body protein 1 homolog [Drosophila innubila]